MSDAAQGQDSFCGDLSQMSEARKGKSRPTEIGRKISEAKKGSVHSAETRQKTSQVLKGLTGDEDCATILHRPNLKITVPLGEGA
jgi:hypothetical protein